MENIILYDIQDQAWAKALPVAQLIAPINETVWMYNKQKSTLKTTNDCLKLENTLYTLLDHYQRLLSVIHQAYYTFLARLIKLEHTQRQFSSLYSFYNGLKKEGIWITYKIALQICFREHYFFEQHDEQILALKNISLSAQEIRQLGESYLQLKKSFGLTLDCLDNNISKRLNQISH